MEMTRREFLKKISAIALATAMPLMLPANAEAVAELESQLAGYSLTLEDLMEARNMLMEQSSGTPSHIVMNSSQLEAFGLQFGVEVNKDSECKIFGMTVIADENCGNDVFKIEKSIFPIS